MSDGAGDVIKEDVIEGEFRVEDDTTPGGASSSGFWCRGCVCPLPAGGRSCPRCGRRFLLPTPDSRRVPAEASRAKSHVMSLVLRDRMGEREWREWQRWRRTAAIFRAGPASVTPPRAPSPRSGPESRP